MICLHHSVLRDFERISSELEPSSGENEFSLVLNDGRTSVRKESLRRRQLLSVQMVIEELSAQSDHLPKGALILVAKVFLPAVDVLSVAYDQVEAEEVKAAVLVLFLEVRGHLQQRTLLLPKNDNNPLARIKVFNPQLRQGY
jgi:hypothetical protein